MAYRYLFADPLTGAIRDELPCRDVTFSRELNGAGGVGGALPLSVVRDVDVDGTIYSYEMMRRSVIAPNNTALWILRDEVVVWGGLIYGVGVNTEDETLEFAGQGFWSYFAHRTNRKKLTFTATEQFTIAETFIDNAQAILDGDLGVTVAWNPAAGSGVLRDRTYYAYERKVVAEAIADLAAVNRGFDFELVAGGTVGAFTKTLHLDYPQRGRSTDIVWEAGKNIVLLDYQEDGDRYANQVTAFGNGEGREMLIADLADTGTGLLVFEAQESRKDVKRISTLEAHAQATLNRLRDGERTCRVSITDSTDAPFGAYIPGDEVRLRISRGWLDMDERWRIQAFTVSPDDGGGETIEVDLAPSSAYAT